MYAQVGGFRVRREPTTLYITPIVSIKKILNVNFKFKFNSSLKSLIFLRQSFFFNTDKNIFDDS